jgi:hypothetical protein
MQEEEEEEEGRDKYIKPARPYTFTPADRFLPRKKKHSGRFIYFFKGSKSLGRDR